MAGFMDFFDTDQARLGMGLLAAAGPRADGAGFGQRLMEGVGSLDSFRKDKATAKARDQMMQAQEMQIQQAKEEAQRSAMMREMAAKFARPGQAGLAPLTGDASTGMLPSAGRAPVAPSYDYAGYASALAQSGNPAGALAIEQSMAKQGPKFSTAPQYDQTGRAFVLADNGEIKYLDGVKARDELIETDLGGTKGFRTKYSPEMLAQLAKSQSPDSKASNSVTMRGQNMTDARARERLSFDQSGGADGGGTTQVQFNKQFGKAPAGYRWTANGGMEFIPGGPADEKAQAQKSGEGTVGGVVADLRDKYTQLDAENGIVSTNNRFGTNIGAYIGASGVGQGVNGMFGTKTQSARDSIAMTRPLLLQSIMKATGMSAKQMDSNAELKLYLATATDPQKGLEANLEALDRIESLYGGGNEKFKAPTKQAATVNGWSLTKE